MERSAGGIATSSTQRCDKLQIPRPVEDARNGGQPCHVYHCTSARGTPERVHPDSRREPQPLWVVRFGPIHNAPAAAIRDIIDGSETRARPILSIVETETGGRSFDVFPSSLDGGGRQESITFLCGYWRIYFTWNERIDFDKPLRFGRRDVFSRWPARVWGVTAVPLFKAYRASCLIN